MGVSINTQGFGALSDKLKLMVANAEEVENEALEFAAEPIQKDAKNSDAFKDRNSDVSKRLRNNILISKVVKKRAGYRVIRVYCKNREAPLVEYGHSGKYAAPHPFLAPAFQRNAAKSRQIIFDKLKEALMSR